MKTKILLLTAIAALVVYSCSSETDEEVQAPAAKLNLKPLKTSNNNNETSRTGDSISLISPQATGPGSGFDPTDPNDPEIVHPGDVKPPKP